jgi:outer membrane protein assembly factor BamA
MKRSFINSTFNIQHSTLLFLALLFVAVPVTAMAQDVTFIPSIDLRGEYDDNVLYTRTYETGDFITRVKPALKMDYATELLKVTSNVAVDIFRYMDETDLDTENQDYGLDGRYQITERWSLSGNCSYVKDTTLESELETTGLADIRQERKRYGGGGGLTYQISEVADAGVDYSHSKTVYEYELSTDYDLDSIALFYNRRLGNQLDMLTFQPYYSWYDSTASKVDNYGLSIGWLHPFSETFSITAFGGARYTKTKYMYQILSFEIIEGIIYPEYVKVDEKDGSWGATADIAMKKTGETYTTSIGYNRDLSYTSYGEPIDSDRIYFRGDKRLTERLRASLAGSLYFNKSQGESENRDERYYSISPSLGYNLTEYHSLRLGYDYQQSLNKILVTDRRADRNRVWLALQFKFPL